MANKIRKTIGIILMIAGAIILLSGLGLNLKFFALLETSPPSYDGKYIHIPFSGVGGTDFPSKFSLNIAPSTSLSEEVCKKVGVYNQGCSILCSIKDLNYTLNNAFCGKDIPIFTPKEKPQAGSVIWGYLACNEQSIPTANVIFIPSGGVACSGEFLVDVNFDIVSKTCEQSSGDICSASETCTTWLNASDTGRCCSANCIKIATCADAIQNQDEIGIDCGGSCPACAIIQPSPIEQETSTETITIKTQNTIKNIIIEQNATSIQQAKQKAATGSIALISGILLIVGGIFMFVWRKNGR